MKSSILHPISLLCRSGSEPHGGGLRGSSSMSQLPETGREPGLQGQLDSLSNQVGGRAG